MISTPVRVPVLDLHRYAGGLTPIGAHTGGQTKSLRFAGADGREYQFRSVDKDPTASLAPQLQLEARHASGTVTALGSGYRGWALGG